jgi:hypothetical protein
LPGSQLLAPCRCSKLASNVCKEQSNAGTVQQVHTHKHKHQGGTT